MKAILAGLSLVFAATYAAAQEPPTPAPSAVTGRYQMLPVEGGIARLDTATGAVSLCRIDATGMICDGIAKGPDGLEARIDTLAARLGRLEGDRTSVIAGLPKTPARSEDAEFDEALTRMTRLLQVFGGIVKELDRESDDRPSNSGEAPNRT